MENMPDRIKSFLFLFFGFSVLVSCNPTDDERCVISPDIKIDLEFKSLEDSLPVIRTKSELVHFFSHHVALRDIFFARKSYPSDSIFVNQLFRRFVQLSFDTLLMETRRIVGNDQSIKEDFSAAFSNIKYYYPQFRVPTVETVITGMESDL